MQALELLQGIKYYFNEYKKEKMYFQKLKVFMNSKVKIFIKSRS